MRTPEGEGEVTSGNLSPILDTGVGSPMSHHRPDRGLGIEVEIRERWVKGRIVQPPFHKASQ